MKLYSWQPNGHGQYSFFTIAESEEEAKKAIDEHIQKNYMDARGQKYEVYGWGTDYYKLTVSDVGQVIENDNS